MAIGYAEPGLADIIARLRASGSVFAEQEAKLLRVSARDPDDLQRMVDERVAGWPIEYVLGFVDFCGLRIALDRGVFVPRQRTEFLVRQAISVAPAHGAVVIDLCCGSGAIGLVLAAALAHSRLYAADIDPLAVRCAERNVGSRGAVFCGDLFDPLPSALQGTADLLVANAPYVPSAELQRLPREARLYEHRVALDGGPQGMRVQLRVIAEAQRWLAPTGHLLLEASARQAEDLCVRCAAHGFRARVARCAEYEATVVIAQRR
jgi:release factor glutamine methyltransferase